MPAQRVGEAALLLWLHESPLKLVRTKLCGFQVCPELHELHGGLLAHGQDPASPLLRVSALQPAPVQRAGLVRCRKADLPGGHEELVALRAYLQLPVLEDADDQGLGVAEDGVHQFPKAEPRVALSELEAMDTPPQAAEVGKHPRVARLILALFRAPVCLAVLQAALQGLQCLPSPAPLPCSPLLTGIQRMPRAAPGVRVAVRIAVPIAQRQAAGLHKRRHDGGATLLAVVGG
mmetsp:Transcript_63398/g.175737  ORF Transcript_63398/g.175737 Transcript_63398/m.175737 type:complete len:233 (+) Transcript_63398:1067-1765(+)